MQPDLVVTDIAMSPSASGAGITTTFNVTVRNMGTAATSNYVATFIDYPAGFSDSFDSFNLPPDNNFFQPSVSYTVSETVTPGSGVGSLNVTATTDDTRFGDPDNAECNESNNSRTESFTFGPDLVVELDTPADTASGDPVILSDTTTNQGAANGTQTSTRFYLSADATLTGADTLLGGRTVPALGANGQSNGNTSVTIPASTAAGNYSVFAVADDTGAVTEANETNNTDSAALVVTDGTPPAVQIDSGPTGPTTDNTPSFTYSVEANATVQCSVDTGIPAFGACSPGAGTHDVTSPLADNAYTFRIRASDPSNNQTTATRSFTVDTQSPPAPTLTGTDPSSPSNDQTPSVIGSAESGSSVKLYLTSDCSGTPAGTGTAAQLATGIQVTVPENTTSEIRATATDAVDHVSSCSAPLSYTEDSSGIDTNILTGPKLKTLSRKATFTFEAIGDGFHHFECAMDDGAFVECASGVTFTGLKRRLHTFHVRAVDDAGNLDQSPDTYTWRIKRPR